MRMQSLKELRVWLSGKAMLPEAEAMVPLVEATQVLQNRQPTIFSDAAFLLQRAKATKPSALEQLMQHFSLDSAQGLELMRMMEALPRIPDDETAAALIEEILSNPCWQEESTAKSHIINHMADAGLKFAHQIIGASTPNAIQRKMKELGTPVVHKTLKNMGVLLGNGFVIGENIPKAMLVAKSKNQYLYSFDMLGEAAKTSAQADNYYTRYLKIIQTSAAEEPKRPDNWFGYRNSVSIKLSALHPRFELTHRKQVMAQLFPRLRKLAITAKENNILLTIDAEESNRFDLTFELFELLVTEPALAGFDGIGLALQAYQKRAYYALDYLVELAKETGRRFPIRLVKGAYWDSEIKHAQAAGLSDYPVFTHKSNTDISYLACAIKMLDSSDYIYPQFATHNAHSIAAILRYATPRNRFEFQKLHGMGDRLFAVLKEDYLCRIYAPVGTHSTLLPYLIRRLLENGANSSFLKQLASDVSDQELLRFPVAQTHHALPLPAHIYGQERQNSSGPEIGNLYQLNELKKELAPFSTVHWQAMPIINGQATPTGETAHISSPSNIHSTSGTCHYATEMEVMKAITLAENGFKPWSQSDVKMRALALERAAYLLEQKQSEAIALLVYEAGKTLKDAISEIRETVDFLRYYAALARRTLEPITLPSIAGEKNKLILRGRGIFLCISPWNFPLAIFTGQIAAALVAGNTVVAKPAEQTPLIAGFMTKILLQAGIPPYALQLLPGSGRTVGQRLVNEPKISGIVFTGSSETALRINMDLSKRTNGIIPFIAETGGQNAMIIDSSALPEQAVDDILLSAFGSSGQRCSALRVLYIPHVIATDILLLLKGAAEQLHIGFPEDLDTDIASVINPEAQKKINDHIEKHRVQVVFQVPVPSLAARKGCYVSPTVIELHSIKELQGEVFGPVLHIIRYDWKNIDAVIKEINATDYALTFGFHSRLDSRINHIVNNVDVGNIYVNRSMTGAVVGQQPFGGHKLSGTGFKAGGPNYLMRFITEIATTTNTTAMGGNVTLLSGVEDGI